MKFFLILIVLILTSSLSIAHDDEMGGVYIGGGISQESPTWYDSGLAGELNIGIPIFRVNTKSVITTEAEVTYSIDSPSKNNIDFTATTVAGYLTYIYDIAPRFYIKPRVGVIYRSFDIDGGSLWGDDTNSNYGFSYGVGGGFRLFEQTNLYLNYTMLDNSDLTHLSIGVEYQF